MTRIVGGVDVEANEYPWQVGLVHCTTLYCTVLYCTVLHCTVQVGYATALDVFIIICFMSVFTALIEFAFINFLDMFIRRLKHRCAV